MRSWRWRRGLSQHAGSVSFSSIPDLHRIISAKLRRRSRAAATKRPVMHRTPTLHHPWARRRIFRLLRHSHDRLVLFMAYTPGSSIWHCVRSVNRILFLLASVAEVAGLQRSKGRSQFGVGQARCLRRRTRERFVKGFSGAGWCRSCGSANNTSDRQS